MGPASHFLFGALCGAGVACVALLWRRRWAAYAPPFILACGFWGELPHLLGFGRTTHWLSNVCFGYGWLHPAFGVGEAAAFAWFVVIASVLLLGYVVFLTRFVWMVDTVRWEQGAWRGKRRRPKRRSQSERTDEE